MSIFSFSDSELEPQQVEKLNSLLPEKFRKNTWKKSDFEGSDSIYERILNVINGANKAIQLLKTKLNKRKESLSDIVARNIKIFNTDLHKAEPLGLVDIGLVERFGSISSGDRFAVGAIGYAVESVFDDSFAKSNAQIGSVEKAKLELLKKARKYYPECNMLFKYEVDFRELGSSGNVFIYMRGTAAKGENKQITEALDRENWEIDQLQKEIEAKKVEVKKLQDLKSKIPQDKWQIDKVLG